MTDARGRLATKSASMRPKQATMWIDRFWDSRVEPICKYLFLKDPGTRVPTAVVDAESGHSVPSISFIEGDAKTVRIKTPSSRGGGDSWAVISIFSQLVQFFEEVQGEFELRNGTVDKKQTTPSASFVIRSDFTGEFYAVTSIVQWKAAEVAAMRAVDTSMDQLWDESREWKKPFSKLMKLVVDYTFLGSVWKAWNILPVLSNHGGRDGVVGKALKRTLGDGNGGDALTVERWYSESLEDESFFTFYEFLIFVGACLASCVRPLPPPARAAMFCQDVIVPACLKVAKEFKHPHVQDAPLLEEGEVQSHLVKKGEQQTKGSVHHRVIPILPLKRIDEKMRNAAKNRHNAQKAKIQRLRKVPPRPSEGRMASARQQDRPDTTSRTHTARSSTASSHLVRYPVSEVKVKLESSQRRKSASDVRGAELNLSNRPASLHRRPLTVPKGGEEALTERHMEEFASDPTRLFASHGVSPMVHYCKERNMFLPRFVRPRVLTSKETRCLPDRKDDNATNDSMKQFWPSCAFKTLQGNASGEGLKPSLAGPSFVENRRQSKEGKVDVGREPEESDWSGHKTMVDSSPDMRTRKTTSGNIESKRKKISTTAAASLLQAWRHNFVVS
eukprot:CAMPEP_0113901752 /NCGR_PEP_ID=MMETSP0780_2-20120614/21434_1 /TAXON_ID=652834 /ORGANISM="Palpitomonas bilix" /LENGTH=614 /DNA_ID=CAMNT_0000894411 /DNA_START=46 /DNA_END=1890 /DNA_ORIENTATION=+ /assembly_acc=CAM_ASM_000599